MKIKLNVLAVAACLLPGVYTAAQSTGALKKRSLDQLLDIQVTSVSKRSERLSDAPTSIYVISAEDIRRSSATTLPEILRLAPEISLWDGLQATLGLKLERNDYTGLEYLPSARLAWKLAEDRLLWSSLSLAVRVPARFDRNVRFPGSPPRLVIGGPSFQSEVANVVELCGVASLPEPAVPACADFDVRLAWFAAETIEISAVARNLLHKRHPEYGAPDTRSEFDRNFYGQIRWHF